MTRARARRPDQPIDPMADAVFKDTLGIAGELETVLAAISGFDQETIKAMLFKKPPGTPGALGRYEFIEAVPPPIDMEAIMASLKTRFGGGDYRVTIFAGGKTRKQIEFSIMGEPKTPSSQTPNDQLGGSSLIMMFMQMNDASRKDMMAQQQFAMEQQRLAADRDRDRTTQLLQTVGLALPVLAPLLFNREKLSDIVAMINANRAEPNSLKDTVETLVAVKGLLGDNSDKSTDFNPDDIVGSIGRLAGPMLGAAGRAFASARNGGQAGAEVHEPPAQIGDGHLHLPAPEPLTITPPAVPSSPVLALIAPHVRYFFANGHDPGLAAEAVTDIMERQGVTDGDLNELVAAFTLSADWKADLAAQGLDLRSDPQWADDFLAQLVDLWTQRDRSGEPEAGRGRGLADVAPDAPTRANGVAVADDPRPGA